MVPEMINSRGCTTPKQEVVQAGKRNSRRVSVGAPLSRWYLLPFREDRRSPNELRYSVGWCAQLQLVYCFQLQLITPQTWKSVRFRESTYRRPCYSQSLFTLTVIPFCLLAQFSFSITWAIDHFVLVYESECWIFFFSFY